MLSMFVVLVVLVVGEMMTKKNGYLTFALGAGAHETDFSLPS